MMTIAELERRLQGKTHKNISDTYGGNPCDISQIERGHRKPWPKLRKAIAAALNVDERDLFEEDGTPLLVDRQLPRRKEVV